MPRSFLTNDEREQFNNIPNSISQEDLASYFSLLDEDKLFIDKQRREHNRLGVALLLCSIRYLGFEPDDINNVPAHVIEYLADQLSISPQCLLQYGQRSQTRSEHVQIILNYLGFRKTKPTDLKVLTEWLIERASEHDKPFLLLQYACEKLKSEKLLRPGITILEGIVTTARTQVKETIYQKLFDYLTLELKQLLDQMLIKDLELNLTPLTWLRFGEVSNSPSAILNAIKKIHYLRSLGVEKWDLNGINPNRQKLLTQLGRRSTNQALQRLDPSQRYPILMAFLKQTLTDTIDELVELFDRCLWHSYLRAKRTIEEERLTNVKTTNEKINLLKQVGDILLNPSIHDKNIRREIYQQIPKEQFQKIITECEQLIRPEDNNCYDYLAKRYAYLREFTPQLLDTLEFCSNKKDHIILKTIDLLRNLNLEEKRKVPEDAPIKFIPKAWVPYVFNQDYTINRRYYELCTLWELRHALRCGEIWVKNSRKYTDPESYLIPKNDWPNLRQEACQQLGLPEVGTLWVKNQETELENLLKQVDKTFSSNKNARIEKGQLILSPLFAEGLSAKVLELQSTINLELPRVDITDLLVEVDGWTQFTACFSHAGGTQAKTKDLLVHIYASILAQACNFGLKKMAEVTGLTYDKLAWCTNWYLREETIQSAINCLVNYQYHQPLSKIFGLGTLSSSDGERIPVPVKSRHAVALPKYFGYGKGLTFYSWTSDQFSQYGTKVIPATVRDATYVLDAILDNETELQIMEHTTDTAGYTELIFGLFALFNMVFMPRIRDLGAQYLYRTKKTSYKHIDTILKGTIRSEYILNNWDDMLRVAASLKLGYVSASLLISKLKSYPKQHTLMRAIQELGRLRKTIHILHALDSETYRRRYGSQLNKGEALHSLRSFLRFANEGNIRKSQLEDQNNQAACLTLLTNAVTVWNTRYMQAIVDKLSNQGNIIPDEDLKHISPCRFEHINKYGKLNFNIEKELNRKELRPLGKQINA